MTLKEEILKEILKVEGVDPEQNPLTNAICESHAKAAASVCRRYIEKAIDEAWGAGWDAEEGKYEGPNTGYSSDDFDHFKEKFLKDNGITE